MKFLKNLPLMLLYYPIILGILGGILAQVLGADVVENSLYGAALGAVLAMVFHFATRKK